MGLLILATSDKMRGIVDMQLKDINFGKVDAKNELTEDSDIQKHQFEQAYLVPDYIDIDALKDGRKYIISGMKGTGKTALLRYVDIQLRKNLNNMTSFILFKSDFSAEDKKGFYAKAENIVDEKEFKCYSDMRDYESMWKWFFFNYIYNCIQNSNSKIFFQKDKSWDLFEKCIKCVELSDNPVIKGIGRFIPKIKQGRIKISMPGFAAELGFEIGSDHCLKFTDIVHKAEQLFENLSPVGENNLYLLVDELEVSFENSKQYERDVTIIRDLVVTTEKLNSLFRRDNYNIYIITSIRSEVLNVVNATGKEINKTVEDFGVQIVWHQSGGSELDHPLIQMIMKRLVVAEGLADSQENRNKVWQKYFPDNMIQNMETERYILYNSWYRPRDIVRMLTKGKDSFPNENAFTHKVFDGIRKGYSAGSWTECMEELKAVYSNDDIAAIKGGFGIDCG